MQSRMQEILGPPFEPVALLFSQEKPEKALQFKEGRFGCVMFAFANAAKGRTAAFDRNTYGCWGGGVGLGFGNTYKQFPGGEEGFKHFLSSGNKDWEEGTNIAENMRQSGADEHFLDDFLEGERYCRGPEEVGGFIDELPIQEVPATYVLFKPLSQVGESEDPKVITFTVNAEQLSAMVVLANFARPGIDNVRIPFAAGCQSIGLLPLEEGKRENPRAVVGLTDISARANVKKLLGRDVLSFSMPLSLFREMEDNVSESFLHRPVWQGLVS